MGWPPSVGIAAIRARIAGWLSDWSDAIRRLPPVIADLPLALRIDGAAARLNSGIAGLARSLYPEAFALPIAGGVASYCGPGSPINKLIGLGLNEPIDEAQLDSIERAFFVHAAPVQAEVASLAMSLNFPIFGRRGYTFQGFEDVLGLDLTPKLPVPPPQVTIATVTPDTLPLWLDTLAAGALSDGTGPGPSPDEPSHEALRVALRQIAQAPGARVYLAYLSGQPVGGASLCLTDGVAQLSGAATLPAFRRRGVQTALLRVRLREAQRDGCSLATITTQPGSTSQVNARRQGFELLYTRALLVKSPGQSLVSSYLGANTGHRNEDERNCSAKDA